MTINERNEKKAWQQMRTLGYKQARATVSGKTPFRLRVAWSQGYEDLFDGRFVRVSEEGEMLDKSLECGRVLMSADAGSGKTWLLARLATHVFETTDAIPVWIFLQDLPATDVSPGEADHIARELIRLSYPPLKEVLSSRGRAPRVIVLADGLNEASREYVQPALEGLDELARRYPFISVVVTDRLARRPLTLSGWQLATVLPLSEGEVERVWRASEVRGPVPANMELLTRPFFLDKALTDKQVGESGAATMEIFYRDRLGLTVEALDSLSAAAFGVYGDRHSRVMDLSRFRERVGQSIVEHLDESGALKVKGNEAWFSHHLWHDFLASRYLAHHEQLWNRQSFDDITLGAASFDALRLTVEQIDRGAVADRFIRLVYDWNYTGAGYSLIEGRVSTEMHVAILAMLAEKRWDPAKITVQSVSDSLLLNNSTISKRMLAAKHRTELNQIVKSVQPKSEEFMRWQSAFSLEDGFPASRELVRKLCLKDPLEAWALSNSLRRCVLDGAATDEVIKIAHSVSPVQRWRAVHVLGMHGSEKTAAALFECLTDKDRWVRIGAIRSLVEQAAMTPALRETLISRLISFIQAGSTDSPMLNELAKVLDIQPQPDDWAISVAPLVQQLIGAAENLVEQERWARVMANIAPPSVDDF